MKFSKEFMQWWENDTDKVHSSTIERAYRAFKAHDEELNKLRKFKKSFEALQNKCQKLEEKIYSLPSEKAVKYQMKLDDEMEGFLYL